MIYIYPPSHRQYLNKIMLLVFQELNHNLNLLALCGVPSLVSTYWALPWCGDLFFSYPHALISSSSFVKCLHRTGGAQHGFF